MAETPKTSIPNAAHERLAAQQVAGDLHPDANLLAAFVERTLAAGEREMVLAHLAMCEGCREVVAVAQPAEPEEAEVIEAERSRWLRWEHLQWGALAAVLVVGAAVLLRSPMMRKDVPPEVQVAQSEAPAAVTSPRVREQEAAKPAAVEADQVRQNAASVNGKPESQSKVVEQGKLADLRDGEMDRIQSAEPKRQVAREEAPAAAAPRESKDDADRYKERAANAPVAGREGSVGPGVAGGAGMSAATSSGSRRATGMVGGALSSQAAPQAAPATAPSDKSEVAHSNNEVVSTESRADRLSKDEKEAGEKAKTEAAYQRPAELPMKKHAAAGNVAEYAINAKAPAARWTISSEGHVQRSLDGGKTWQEAKVADRVRFRAVAAIGQNVWAGGSGEALFHSADGGETWERSSFSSARLRMEPGIAGGIPDIVRIDFRDEKHGVVETSAKETWATDDGGKTWKQKQ